MPGKALYTADTLSQAPLELSETDSSPQGEAELLLEMCLSNLPANKERLDEYRASQSTDPVCSLVINYCCNGWPAKQDVDGIIKPYWEVQGELTVGNSLLLYGSRIVVPRALQQQTLKKIHEGHQGIQRCRIRARNSVWWPEMSQQIQEFVKKCAICAKESRANLQPMIATQLPDYPWQRVGTDLFQLKGSTYIIVIDYFSRYPEVIKLKGTTSGHVIGIPETVVSDNGPQYSSQEFTDFARQYDFCHLTSSPLYPQSNGQAERGVQTVKGLLKEVDDPYMSLLNYRTTPFPWCNLSPAELSMGRQLRSNLPQIKDKQRPAWPYLEEFCKQNELFKQRQKADFDRRHRVRPLPPIPSDTEVWITSGDQPIPGRVTATALTPRSYLVETSPGHAHIRRNRQHINVVPDNHSISEDTRLESSPRRIMTRSQTGTLIRPPERF